MGDAVIVLVSAFAVDRLIGDPVYPFHPVRLIGRTIIAVESMLRRLGQTEYIGGLFLVFLVLLISIGSYIGMHHIAQLGHPMLTLLIDIFLATSCIAFQDLFSHARKVAKALEKNDLEKAQHAVQMIVGRDARQLDAQGVARAAVESVAESFVDGLLAPVFWFFAGAGLFMFVSELPSMGAIIGILGYRVINTMDSMVGYKNQQYMRFGTAAARLDDAANFLPARLSIPFIVTAALISKYDWKNSIKIGLRDRLKHTSPNAGHAESCMAGALDIQLGGPTTYSNGLIKKPWLGDGCRNLSSEQIRHSIRLISFAGCAAFAVSCLCIILFA